MSLSQVFSFVVCRCRVAGPTVAEHLYCEQQTISLVL